MVIKNYFNKSWEFLQKDSWQSFAVSMIIAFVVIKFIFFPTLSLVTGTKLPLVIVESCSMHHHVDGFSKTFESPIYGEHGISINDTKNWIFQNGFNKGDVVFVVGAKNIKIGDVIIFNAAGHSVPIIHRVIEDGSVYQTKGDNDETNNGQGPFDKHILKNQVLGKALFKVPFIGWAKLIFFEVGRAPRERGMCK